MSALTWQEVRARSAKPEDSLCCADCYFAFELLGTACAKHATTEEKAVEHAKLKEQSLRENPVFAMLRKDKPQRDYTVKPLVETFTYKRGVRVKDGE